MTRERHSMRTIPFGIAVAAACLAGATAFGAERTLSADGKTLTFDVPADAVYTNTVPIETTVTNIVKVGGGEACFVPQTNDVYTGGILIREGFLSGLQRSFGKPAAITVESDPATGVGGAIVFLDLLPGTLTTTQSPFWNTKWHVSGAGPDGTGAIQRPVTHCDHVVNGLMKEIWLDGDTTINCGSRWGFAYTTLYMNNHKLTLTASRTTWPGSATKHDANYSRIFQFARSGDLAIKDPGEVFLTGNCRLLIEGSVKVKDAAGSNGSVSNMLVTVDRNCELRIFSVNQASAPTFRTHFLDGSAFNVNGGGHYKGAITLEGPSVTLHQYSASAHAYLYGGMTGPARVMHEILAKYDFLDSGTNYVNGITQRSGLMTFGGDTTFYVTNSFYIGSTTLDVPAEVNVVGNARLLACDGMRKRGEERRILVGAYWAGDAKTYGILRIGDNAVVSNQVAIGGYGRGAVYLSGNAELDFCDGFSDNNAHITGSQGTNGEHAYGYLGMLGGLARQNFWFNIGGNGNTRAFVVQRGGRFEHNGLNEPVRFGFSGASHCAYAQLGGTSTWKNVATFGFANYTPTCVNSVGSLTVAGEGTLMDMSPSANASYPGILCCANTNAAAPNTANVNVNDGGTLYVPRIWRGQVNSSSTPAWASITSLVAAGSQYYLNFNGGILKTAKAGEFFGSSATDSVRELTRATVYEKGATIDTDGKDVTWRMALEKPYGLGIQSVALPAEVLATTATNLFIGPTRPVVDNLSRHGRTTDLLLDFDDRTRRVTGVIVNARGFGFTSAPTVTFEKGDASATWSCTPTMVDFDDPSFAHGGLTKRGAGKLTLTRANTYGGATRLEGGTLMFSHRLGYPGGDLELPAAAVSALTASSEPLLMAHTLAFAAGKGVRVTEADTLDDETFGRVKTVATFATPLTAVPSLTLVARDGTPISSQLWKLSLADGGMALKFGPARGTVIILR